MFFFFWKIIATVFAVRVQLYTLFDVLYMMNIRLEDTYDDMKNLYSWCTYLCRRTIDVPVLQLSTASSTYLLTSTPRYRQRIKCHYCCCCNELVTTLSDWSSFQNPTVLFTAILQVSPMYLQSISVGRKQYIYVAS